MIQNRKSSGGFHEFRVGFGRGVKAGLKTSYNVANTASLGAVNAAVSQAQQTARDIRGRDFAPIADALRG